ncbi:hypothetical protein B1756_00030 [Natrarchaeobaculum aegyptiacum]|uniref:Small CPxCG-related zinc finger protein n=1 Tax=Natrarchaeobaculum aegyptiacum TaxID=745377 RepID=A0A2Z2HTC2_9EURY|nr:hypothetical protein B1756_00030 [Natrarchaeobaculum aegyptiacum]
MRRSTRSSRTRRSRPTTVRETISAVLFRSSEPATVEECRRCGTTVDPTTSCCPNCGRDDIVTHRIR